MTFRHFRTDDPTNPASDSHSRLLERLLIRHAAEGLDVLELRRQMGKNGYVPTEHRWENDGNGEDLTDEDGNVLLIAGVPPADLAAELIDTARQHVDETNERKNYRLVALRTTEGIDGGEEQEEVFRFLLPATMFGAVGDGTPPSESREQHDALMAANHQLQRQNDMLFRMLMDVVRQYPVVLGKSTELLEQLGDQLGGGRQQDLQQVLSILEFESGRDQRWMAHDRAKQRAGHRADLLGKSVAVAGPDLMVLLRKLVEELMAASKNTANVDPSADASTREQSHHPNTVNASETTVNRTARYADRLNQLLSRVPAPGIAKARKLLDEYEWALLEAARRAESDDEFAAIIAKLTEGWTAQGEAKTEARMAGLIDALGMSSAMALGKLIEEVQAG
ncbi:MAG: hypothetical protein AAF799_48110 [Myxococcota bacterium]